MAHTYTHTHTHIYIKYIKMIKQWPILHLAQTSIMYCTLPWMKPQTLPHTWVMSHDFFCVRITTFSSSSVDLIPGLVMYESFRKDPILGKHKVWCNSRKFTIYNIFSNFHRCLVSIALSFRVVPPRNFPQCLAKFGYRPDMKVKSFKKEYFHILATCWNLL